MGVISHSAAGRVAIISGGPLSLARMGIRALFVLGCSVVPTVDAESIDVFDNPTDASQPDRVADLRYGVALYHYYQQDYFSALSELMVAKEAGGISDHGTHPLLVEGAISLAFGMEQHAMAQFTRVTLAQSLQSERDVAWFSLGKMAYRRGDWVQARDSFARIEEPLQEGQQQELLALQVNLAIRAGNLDQGESLLADAQEMGSWQPYIDYNLGTAYLKQAHSARGLAYLQQLLARPAVNEEERALRDRALVAAAYGLLRRDEPGAAQAHFKRVRAQSPMAGRALLGYGWAKAREAQYQEALNPWQQLAAGRPYEVTVQEALLAVPYAYEQLGGPQQAQRAYARADQLLGNEIERLALLSTDIQRSGLLKAFDARQGDNTHWYQLVEVLSGERFQDYRQLLGELQMLRKNLLGWNQELQTYSALLATQLATQVREPEQAPAGLLSQQRAKSSSGFDQRMQTLRERQQRLLLAINSAERTGNWLLLGGDDSARQWRRVLRAQQRIDLLTSQGLPMGDTQERLRRYRGMLLWHSSEHADQWRLQALAIVQHLEQSLAMARQDKARLQQRALQAEPVTDSLDVAGLQSRVKQYDQRLRVQWRELGRLEEQYEASFRAYVVAALGTQLDRMRRYQAQARLAQARLSDQAAL
jgi:hypothetical protein